MAIGEPHIALIVGLGRVVYQVDGLASDVEPQYVIEFHGRPHEVLLAGRQVVGRLVHVPGDHAAESQVIGEAFGDFPVGDDGRRTGGHRRLVLEERPGSVGVVDVAMAVDDGVDRRVGHGPDGPQERRPGWSHSGVADQQPSVGFEDGAVDDW